MIKLIALDIDGTLVKDDKTISKETLNVLNKAHDQGVIISAATGRPLNAIPAPFYTLNGSRYIISSNGATVWDMKNEKYLRRSYLSKEQAILLLDAIGNVDNKPVWKEICISGKSYSLKKHFDYLDNYVIDGVTSDYLKETRISVDSYEELFANNNDEIERVSCFSNDLDYLDEVRERIKTIPDINPTQALPRDLEIGHKESSKGKALKYLAEYLGIDRSEVMAFGDGLNDCDMLEYAGIGVAMGNGAEGLFEYADYVTATNENDGLAEAVKKFVLS